MSRNEDQPKHLVEVNNVSLVFGRQTILDRIQLVIPRGQTLAIIGESGCGKTMLLKSMVGLQKPTSGSIHFDGVDIHSLNEIEMTALRKRFGFVFQNAALFDSMTIGQTWLSRFGSMGYHEVNRRNGWCFDVWKRLDYPTL